MALDGASADRMVDELPAGSRAMARSVDPVWRSTPHWRRHGAVGGFSRHVPHPPGAFGCGTRPQRRRRFDLLIHEPISACTSSENQKPSRPPVGMKSLRANLFYSTSAVAAIEAAVSGTRPFSMSFTAVGERTPSSTVGFRSPDAYPPNFSTSSIAAAPVASRELCPRAKADAVN